MITVKYALQDLKQELGVRLLHANHLTPPEGCPTEFSQLDQFLIWKGFPKGALSLLKGPMGMGATRLWAKAAAHLTHEGRWAAWINGPQAGLNPWSLRQYHVNLDKVLCVSCPKDVSQKLWALQELLSLSLFDLVGCDLGEDILKPSQILKLQKLARRYQTALVLFSPLQHSHSFFSLIVNFTNNHMIVERALHRPTPYNIKRRDLYADTLPQLAEGRITLCC